MGVSSRVRFGDFDVNLRSGELRRNGLKVKLGDQSFQVLALLLESPGEVVTREQLRQKLWTEDTFVDFDAGLNSAIKRLRDALGDSADQPRFVETLPRHGYRFLAPVERSDDPEPAPAAMPPITVPELEAVPRRTLARTVAIAAGAAIVLLGVLIALNVGGWRDRLFSGGTPKVESLAVLPLENLTGDPSQDYFVDGMTDALITDLAQISSLRVISRTSAMQYKGKNKPLPQIAHELKVDAIVEGTVARSGNRVRITAQLIHAPTDRHLWAKEYDRELSDILLLQNEVARDIADEIRVQLTPPETARLTARRAVHPQAYDAYVKGRYFWNQRTAEGFRKAIGYFQQAIELEPAYAEAYSGLSDCYRLLQFVDAASPAESWPKAKAAAEKAIALDPSLAEARNSLAVFKYRHDWDWAGAEAEFKRTLELNPNYAEGHRAYGVYLFVVGRFDESQAQMERTLELDPLSVAHRTDLGGSLYFARRYDEAIRQFRTALEMNPSFPHAHGMLGRSLTEKSVFPEAIQEHEKAITLSGGNPIYLADLAYTYAIAGQTAEARKRLGELKQLSRKRHVPNFSFAEVYAGFGDRERAFFYLEEAYKERSFRLAIINVDPPLDPLRSDPRFVALVRRMGLVPSPATK